MTSFSQSKRLRQFCAALAIKSISRPDQGSSALINVPVHQSRAAGEECMSLSSGNLKDDLSFIPGEADIIMLSFYAALRSSSYCNPVVIAAEDTDMYIQRAAISHDIPGIICIKKKKKLFFCRGMCTDEEIVKCLILFHDMTGCDANSCFYGHGKMLLYKKMAKSLDARSLLLKCVSKAFQRMMMSSITIIPMLSAKCIVIYRVI